VVRVVARLLAARLPLHTPRPTHRQSLQPVGSPPTLGKGTWPRRRCMQSRMHRRAGSKPSEPAPPRPCRGGPVRPFPSRDRPAGAL